jgi:hypothetical protein
MKVDEVMPVSGRGFHFTEAPAGLCWPMPQETSMTQVRRPGQVDLTLKQQATAAVQDKVGGGELHLSIESLCEKKPLLLNFCAIVGEYLIQRVLHRRYLGSYVPKYRLCGFSTAALRISEIRELHARAIMVGD